MAITSNVSSFLQVVKQGVRPNMFQVDISFPESIDADDTLVSYMCKSAVLPAANIGVIEVPFRGRTVKIAGDRTFDETWSTTFMNDTDFMIRNSMERWSNGINDLAAGTGVIAPADYQTDLFVDHLDRDDTVLKSYIFRSAWPTGISSIELTNDAQDAIETFDVTWRYQHFEASGVNF